MGKQGVEVRKCQYCSYLCNLDFDALHVCTLYTREIVCDCVVSIMPINRGAKIRFAVNFKSDVSECLKS